MTKATDDKKKKKVIVERPDGEAVDIDESTERFTEIKLKDGTTLRLKTVVLEAIRSNNEYNDQGDPVYYIKHGVIVSATVPDKLKKKS